MAAKVDRRAATVTVNGRGVVRVDEIPVFVVVWRGGEMWLQFRDRNKQRCRVRGAACVEVPLDTMTAKLTKMIERHSDGRG